MEFLVSTGLANQEGSKYSVGEVQVRIGNSSPNIIRHHAHWRQQAIDSLERETPRDLHYSAVVSLCEEDVIKIKDNTLKFIQESLKTIRESKEEKLFSFTIDFFDLKRP